MLRRRYGIVALLAAVLPLTGACSSEPAECQGLQAPGFIIELSDAMSGEPVCDAEVVLEHQRYRDVLAAQGPGPCFYVGGNVEGHYLITVEHDDFAPQQSEVVVDTVGACGLDTRELQLELLPES